MVACFCNALQRRMSLTHNSNSGGMGVMHSNTGLSMPNMNHGSRSSNPQVGGGLFGGGWFPHNTISKILCTMIRSSICLRLTPVGLAPMVSDITLVLPYTQMSKLQIDFLQDILQSATFNACANTGDPIKAVAYGNEVVVVTTLNSQRIWTGNAMERAPLPHCFANDSMKHCNVWTSGKRKKGMVVTDDTHCKNARKQRKLMEACKLISGGYSSVNAGDPPRNGYVDFSASRQAPVGSGYMLDEAEVLKAFCACVFRSRVHQSSSLREGICNVILQMVIGEVGTTKDVLQNVSEFVSAAKEVLT